jgi:hypothetical protein
MHGGPLSGLSCNPPQQSSSQLTVGTLDSNGQPANASGSVRYDAIPGDVRIAVSMLDVRKQSDLSDYTGELRADQTLRITDRYNGPSLDEPATLQDVSFPLTVPCSATPNTAIGATCAATTTANALVPGVLTAGNRTIWQLGQVQLFDGGADGVAGTQPNTLFADEGIFVP